MDVADMTNLVDDPELREKAGQETKRLNDELREKVRAETRDIGVLRKELTIIVPAEVIATHTAHNYDELMGDVHLPGFRKGRAPRKLIEKRFGAEVRETMKSTIVGQGYFAAVEREKLDVLGEPLFRISADGGEKLVEFNTALEKIELPASGDLTYTVELELRPKFDLPTLEGIELKTPQVTITDEMINGQIELQCKNRGRLEPTDGAAAGDEDVLIADVTLYCEDKQVKHEENVQLGVRPSRLDGIVLQNLADVLRGAKIGEERSIDCSISDDYERADLRGKPARFDFKIHEIKRLVPVTVEQLVENLGMGGEQELREYTRSVLEIERDDLERRAKQVQVEEYLLKNTAIDLPEGLSARQTDRAIIRRVLELQQSGVPMTEIEAQIDALRTHASEDVRRNLKLAFILDAISHRLGIRVTEEELNAAIGAIARRYNRRYDRVRDELQSQGLLLQLAEQIRHDKAIEQLIGNAKYNAGNA